MRISISIISLMAIFLSLVSFNYYWNEDKVTTVEFDYFSNQLDSVQLVFEKNGNWDIQSIINKPYSTGEKATYSFTYISNLYPKQVRFKLGSTTDSVRITNLNISNDLNVVFTPEFEYNGGDNVGIIYFETNNNIWVSTINGHSNISFRSYPEIPFVQKFKSTSVVEYLFILVFSLLAGRLVFYLLPEKINIQHVTLATFLFIISFALLNHSLQVIPEPENEENRSLANKPNFELSFNYLKDLERYLLDHFALRTYLARIDALFKINILKTSSQPNKVVVGNNGMMFPVGMQTLEDFKHQIRFSEVQKQIIAKNLIERQEWMKQKGIPYLFVILPSKHSIIGDNMPADHIPGQTFNLHEDVINHLKTYPELKILDLSDFLAEKSFTYKQPLFYTNDLHWNNLGAFLSYQIIMDKISEFYPEIQPLKFSDFDTSAAYYTDGDLAKMILVNNQKPKREVEFNLKIDEHVTRHMFYKGLTHGEQTINPTKTRKLLMFRDSYCKNLIPFIGNHFNQCTYIWSHALDAELINTLKPDMVLHELVDMYFATLLTANSDIIRHELDTSKTIKRLD